jgi:alpha-glucan, water dikinase
MEPVKNWWHNNNHANFQIPLALTQKPDPVVEAGAVDPDLLSLGLKLADVVTQIIQCETVYESWTLMHRYHRCRDILKDKAQLDDCSYAAFMYIWLRYSFIRQLTWQKRYNTKPKDLQHA